MFLSGLLFLGTVATKITDMVRQISNAQPSGSAETQSHSTTSQ
jgi:hypothetical protein